MRQKHNSPRMIDLHLGASALRWRFLYAVSFDGCAILAEVKELIDNYMLLPQNTADSIVVNPAPQKLPQFFQHTPLYYYGIRSNRAETVAAAIEINPETCKVTVYFDLTDPVNYRNSKYILHGDIFCSDANIRIFCSNPFLGGDFIMINCRTAALMDDRVFAFAATLTPNYRIRASKAFLTPERLHNPNSILPQLKITKEQLKEAKKNDYFVF